MAGPATIVNGPYMSGDKFYPDQVGPANLGYCQLAQILGPFTITTSAQSQSFAVPPGSIIHDIEIDITTAIGDAIPTIDIGLTAGGTDFASAYGITVSSSGRFRWAPTATQLTNAYNQAEIANAGQLLYIQYSNTVAGGVFWVTFEYIQTVQSLDSLM